MSVSTIEVQTDPPKPALHERFLRIFQTGFSEIRRKGSIARLQLEIKSYEREKSKYVHALGVRAWEAHLHHPDLDGILVSLKELQIEMNRLKTQFGENDTQINDIESSKNEKTDDFNRKLDQIEQKIVPHRQRIETIHAEEQDHKIQIEEFRQQESRISQDIRNHQQNIQELDLGDDADKEAQIRIQQERIRNLSLQKCEIDCKMPFLHAGVQKLNLALAKEKSAIHGLETEKESCKREFEKRINEGNREIHGLEDKKKEISRQMEHYRKEMQPFLYDLGRKVEPLRLGEHNFRENYEQLDDLNHEIETRRKQIIEAESLSRAMDRSAWNRFLVFSGSLAILFVSAVFLILR